VERPLSIKHWPAHARLVNEVAAQLQRRFGTDPIPTAEIREAIERAIRVELADTKGPSWYSLPSDYCYNSINRGAFSFEYPVVKVEHGRYRYMGPDHPYSGSIQWKSQTVGEYRNGCYTLFSDPRYARPPSGGSLWSPRLCESDGCPLTCRTCA